MTRSGEGCPAVEVSCEGERAEVAVSGEGERAAVAASGESGLAGEAVSGEGVLAAQAVSVEGVLAAEVVSGEGGLAAEAVSCEGGLAAVAVSGEGGLAAEPVSGDGRRAVAISGEGGGAVAVSGKGKRKRDLLFSLDYPCTGRLRLRRLLAYLREYWCDHTYDVAKRQMRVIFHKEDLVKKVKAGRWREAFHYVRDFAPITESSKEADILSLFLEDLMAISGFADGNTIMAGTVCDWFRRIYRHPVLDKYPFFATIVADVLFLRAQHLRNSLDWQLVRNKAAEMVEEMANKTPELKDRMRYPRGQNDLYGLMPIRSSFGQRRQVKNLGQKQSTELAQFYLQLKKMLPSSSQPETHADSAGSKRGDGEILISLLDKALQAGRQMGHPSQYLSKEGFPLEAVLTVEAKPEPFGNQGHQLEYATKQVQERRQWDGAPFK